MLVPNRWWAVTLELANTVYVIDSGVPATISFEFLGCFKKCY